MNTFSHAAISGSKRRKAAAFTLLELLVVISIIAVLAGILLPVTSSVMENARKTEAKSTEAQIVTSIKSFYADYGVYPTIPSVTIAGSDTLLDGTSNQSLFNILRNAETGNTIVNTRHIVYFEGKDAKSATKPKSGFVPAGGAGATSANGGPLAAGALVDPWGNGYFVRYDTGYTDAVLNPYAGAGVNDNENAGSPTTMLRFGVIAWSYGKDGKKGAAGNVGTAPTYTYAGNDDVVSWQ